MNNLQILKSNLKTLEIDYFLLPNADEYQSEYLPEYAKRIEFLTGFTGSNAFVIIGQKKSAFFTDGRYTLQAENEVNKKDFELYNLSQTTPLNWLLENSGSNSKIGFDANLHSVNQIQNYQKYFGKNLVFLDKNPVDEIWKNQPKPPKTKVFEHKIKYCGESSKDKISKILHGSKEDAIILTNPASICWLFNIRASDVEYSPLHLTFAIIYKNGKHELFKNKLPKFSQKIKSIQTDFSQTNYALFKDLEKLKINITNKTDPCLILKAVKNEHEIRNAIEAHKIDGLAVTKFLYWISQNQKTDELKAAEKLLDLRKENKKFLYESFAAISGFGSNGAIIHYHSNSKTNKKFTQNSLYLIDSGGQYQEGTTDITRTVAIGTPTNEMIENFTRVLKGHIAIARAKFPHGTLGNNLDILARYHLWQAGLDYEHGTGHGVGSFSSVHESPPNISKRSDGIALQIGMILSNEPGFYKKGEYGIRIENLLLVQKEESLENEKFLSFKTLTLAPIDPNLIDFKMLTYPEKKWLLEYHQRIFDEFKNHLNLDEKEWLQKLLKQFIV